MMRRISDITTPALAASALRAYLFWASRCRVLATAAYATDAERQVVQRNRDAFHAQYRLLTQESVQ